MHMKLDCVQGLCNSTMGMGGGYVQLRRRSAKVGVPEDEGRWVTPSELQPSIHPQSAQRMREALH